MIRDVMSSSKAIKIPDVENYVSFIIRYCTSDKCIYCYCSVIIYKCTPIKMPPKVVFKVMTFKSFPLLILFNFLRKKIKVMTKVKL